MERARVFFPGVKIGHDQVTQTLLNFDQSSYFNGLTETTNIWSALDELGGAERGHTSDDKTPPRPEDFSKLFNRANSVDLRKLLRDIEIVMIEKALERNSSNTSEAAKDLHLQRTTLIEKIKKYSI